MTTSEESAGREEAKESLLLVPYEDSREDGGSSSYKGFAIDHD